MLQDPRVEIDPEITFQVTVPESSPADAEIWISGNVPTLGSWDGRGLLASKVADKTYRIGQTFPVGTHIEFKVTRGSWATVEKDSSGEEISNRMHEVTQAETLMVEVSTWRDVVEGTPPEPSLTGAFALHENVTSRYLAHARNVIVYLPPSYSDESDERFPVLYMHDGQNVFDRATSFLGIEWEVDETAERLIGSGEIRPLIVVGVYNGPDRVGEYTQVPDPDRGGGGADKYGRFLVEELKPFIDANYRTLTDRENTGVAGSSLGGLVSIYFAFSLEDTFSRIGVVSPAVFWADDHIVQLVKDSKKVDSRIWLDVGTREGSTPEEQVRWVESARHLRDALIAKGWVPGEDLRYSEDEDAVHNEAAWAGRMELILKFLYPAEVDGAER